MGMDHISSCDDGVGQAKPTPALLNGRGFYETAVNQAGGRWGQKVN